MENTLSSYFIYYSNVKEELEMSNTETQVLRILNGVNQGTKRTHTFTVDFTEYGEKFKGKFTVHHPSQMERMRIGILQSQLTGGVVPTDVRTDNLVHIISTLDIVLDEKPEWFDIYSEELEYEMMVAVYKEYVNWMASFRKSVGRDNTGETSGNTES